MIFPQSNPSLLSSHLGILHFIGLDDVVCEYFLMGIKRWLTDVYLGWLKWYQASHMFPAEPSPQMLLLHDSLIWGLPGSAKWVRYQCLQSNWLLGKELFQKGWKGGIGEGELVLALETFWRKLSGLFVFLAFGCGPWWSQKNGMSANWTQMTVKLLPQLAAEWAVLERWAKGGWWHETSGTKGLGWNSWLWSFPSGEEVGHLAFRMEMKDVDVGKQVASSSLLRCMCWKKAKIYVDKSLKPVKCLILLEGRLLFPFLSQNNLWESGGNA